MKNPFAPFPFRWIIKILFSGIGYALVWKLIPWEAVKNSLLNAQFGWVGLALALCWLAGEARQRGMISMGLTRHAPVLLWHEAMMALLLALASGFLNQPLNSFSGFPLWGYAVVWGLITVIFLAGNRLFFRNQSHPRLLLISLSVQALLVSGGLCLMYAVGEHTRPLEYALLLAGAQALTPITVAGAGIREALFSSASEWLPIEAAQGVAVSLGWLLVVGLVTLLRFRRDNPLRS